jgi:tetratricopeptide (TPR) repeat protein
MLGVFGGKGGNGDIVGLLGSPVAIEQRGDKVFIVDSTKNAVIVYEMTEFGSNIKKANNLYIEGQYEESVKPWREVLKMNANYELAYVGIGNALYKQEKYEEAMKYFDLGNNKKGYSKAKKEYRTIVLKQNFPYIMTGLILLLILLAIWKRIARKHNLSFKRLYGEE